MKLLFALMMVLAALLGGMVMVFEAPYRFGEILPILVGLGYAGAVIAILRGPIGQALVRELTDGREGTPSLPPGETGPLNALVDEVEDNREELRELQERLDFAERLIAQRLGPDAPVREP